MRDLGHLLTLCCLLSACSQRARLPEPSMPLSDNDRSRFPGQPGIPSQVPAQIPEISSFQLSNGLNVHVLEQPGKPEVVLHSGNARLAASRIWLSSRSVSWESITSVCSPLRAAR